MWVPHTCERMYIQSVYKHIPRVFADRSLVSINNNSPIKNKLELYNLKNNLSYLIRLAIISVFDDVFQRPLFVDLTI